MQMLLLYVKVFRYSCFIIWKSVLSVLVRIICLMVVILISTSPVSWAASVPITAEEDYDGLPEPQNTILSPIKAILDPIIDEERKTCDPEFWEVLKDRAWQEGQREITQNNNLIARPDSVLQMTCFDFFADHLTTYADNNFPGDPQEAAGQMTGGIVGAALGWLSGLFTEWTVLAFDEVTYLNGFGILKTDGFLMFAVLELLVLDQLVDDVPQDKPSDIMRGMDIAENPTLSACAAEYGGEYKQYYADDNFPTKFLGGRSSIDTKLNGEANDDINYACTRMSSVWHEAKCYNMLAESNIFGVIPNHDGFYPLLPLSASSALPNYRDEAANGRDFRTKETMCGIPPVDNDPDLPSGGEYACQLAAHGVPTIFTSIPTNLSEFMSLLSTVGAFFNINPLPTWATASTGANPASGATGGVDQYMHFLGLRDSTACSSISPIKTGYIVTAPNGDRYVDAVCPAPGCYFIPPSTIAGNGSCN